MTFHSILCNQPNQEKLADRNNDILQNVTEHLSRMLLFVADKLPVSTFCHSKNITSMLKWSMKLSNSSLMHLRPATVQMPERQYSHSPLLDLQQPEKCVHLNENVLTWFENAC